MDCVHCLMLFLLFMWYFQNCFVLSFLLDCSVGMAHEEGSFEKQKVPNWASMLLSSSNKSGYVCGFIDDKEKLEEILELHSDDTLTDFIKSHKDNSKNRQSIRQQAPRLLWKYGSISFDGTPFMVVESKELQCQFGHPRKYSLKKKKECVAMTDHTYANRKRLHLQKGRKIGCPATILIKELLKFPSHSTQKSSCATTKEKKLLMDDLKRKLYSGEVQGTTKYFVSLPHKNVHNHRLYGLARRMSYHVKQKIRTLVSEGITNVNTINKLIHIDDKDSSHISTDRAYFPKKKDISNCIQSLISTGKNSILDQLQLENLASEWQSKSIKKYGDASSCFLRKSEKRNDNESHAEGIPTSDDQSFLFVYQEDWQKKLLVKYGNTLSLLDATYKTTKYLLPLFLLCVRSNCGYIPVAVFIIEQETTKSITEALKIISSWNENWKPSYFMVDYSEAEINAISSVFPKVYVYICEFHREQAWTRWTRNAQHNLSLEEQGELLHHLRKVAFAQTVEAYQSNLTALFQSAVYINNSNVRNYLQSQWLKCVQRWCDVFRKPGFHASVRTNNGVEAQNKLFKSCYNTLRTDRTVSGLCELIVHTFLPDALQKYLESNIKFSSDYKLYNPDIPQYLQNRPHYFIRHCMKRSSLANLEFKIEDVQKIDSCVFLVKSQSESQHGDSHWHSVHIGNAEEFPRCDCYDFIRNYLPCKHFFAIFTHHSPEYSWYSLPDYFRNSPFVTIDESFVFKYAGFGQQQALITNDITGQDNPMVYEETSRDPDSLEVQGCHSDSSTEITQGEVNVEFHDSTTRSNLNSGTTCTISQISVQLRSNLHWLINYSYSCKNHSAMVNINDKIKDIAQEASETLPTESGLYLNYTQAPVRKRKGTGSIISKAAASTCRIRSLPAQKRKKKLSLLERYKNRVGTHADNIKSFSNINVLRSRSKSIMSKRIRKSRSNLKTA